MRVRFLRDEIYETGGPNIGQRFATGEVHDLRDDLAQRWIRRGAAVVEVAVPDVAAGPPSARVAAAAATTPAPEAPDGTTGHPKPHPQASKWRPVVRGKAQE